MNIEQYKSDYLEKRMQLVLFEKETGHIIYSSETLFAVLSYSSVFAVNPFLESIYFSLKSLPLDESLAFSCVNVEVEGKRKYYDYQFQVPSKREEDIVVWQIFDFSDHYESLVTVQQQRNESEMMRELQEMEQEKVRLEKELLEYQKNEQERLQKLKTDFFAKVSHEIRNPANGIAGLVHLIRNSSEAERKEYLNALASTSNHLVNLINNVLDLSKLESSSENLPETVSFDPKEVVRIAVDNCLYDATSKGITLAFNIDPDVPQHLSHLIRKVLGKHW